MKWKRKRKRQPTETAEQWRTRHAKPDTRRRVPVWEGIDDLRAGRAAGRAAGRKAGTHE